MELLSLWPQIVRQLLPLRRIQKRGQRRMELFGAVPNAFKHAVPDCRSGCLVLAELEVEQQEGGHRREKANGLRLNQVVYALM